MHIRTGHSEADIPIVDEGRTTYIPAGEYPVPLPVEMYRLLVVGYASYLACLCPDSCGNSVVAQSYQPVPDECTT